MIRKTGKIKAVSEYLGHKSVNTIADMYKDETLHPTDLNMLDV
jgi:integrase